MITGALLCQLLIQAQQDGIHKFVAGAIITNNKNMVLLLLRKSDDFIKRTSCAISGISGAL